MFWQEYFNFCKRVLISKLTKTYCPQVLLNTLKWPLAAPFLFAYIYVKGEDINSFHPSCALQTQNLTGIQQLTLCTFIAPPLLLSVNNIFSQLQSQMLYIPSVWCRLHKPFCLSHILLDVMRPMFSQEDLVQLQSLAIWVDLWQTPKTDMLEV